MPTFRINSNDTCEAKELVNVHLRGERGREGKERRGEGEGLNWKGRKRKMFVVQISQRESLDEFEAIPNISGGV